MSSTRSGCATRCPTTVRAASRWRRAFQTTRPPRRRGPRTHAPPPQPSPRAEVPLPPGVQPPGDDSDDLLLRKHEPRGRGAERERWGDLGLDALH